MSSEYFSGIFNDYTIGTAAVLHFAGLGMHNNHLFESYFLYWKSLGGGASHPFSSSTDITAIRTFKNVLPLCNYSKKKLSI